MPFFRKAPVYTSPMIRRCSLASSSWKVPILVEDGRWIAIRRAPYLRQLDYIEGKLVCSQKKEMDQWHNHGDKEDEHWALLHVLHAPLLPCSSG